MSCIIKNFQTKSAVQKIVVAAVTALLALQSFPAPAQGNDKSTIVPVLALLLKGSSQAVEPTVFSLVEATAVFTDKVSASWIPATSDNTSSNKIKYTVHVGATPGFDLAATLFSKEVIGIDSTILTGLTPNRQYYIRVVAEDKDGDTSWSNELAFKTPATNPTLKAGVVVKEVDTSGAQTTITDTSVSFPASGAPLPQAGEFIVSDDPANGLLRKVVGSSENNGVVTVQTEAAALKDVYKNLTISFNTRLDSSGSSPKAASKFFAKSSASVGNRHIRSGRIWKESGFGILSAGNGKNNSKIMIKRTVLGSKEKKIKKAVNTRVKMTASSVPANFIIGKTQTFTIELERTTAGAAAGWTLGDLKVDEFDIPGFTTGNVDNNSYNLTFQNQTGSQKKRYSFSWTPTLDDYDPDLGSYTLDLVGEASRTTCTDTIFGPWCTTDTEEVELRLEFLLLKGSEIDFNDKVALNKNITHGNMSYGIEADYSFTPQFFSTIDIDPTKINKVEAGLSGTLKLNGKLSVQASADGTYEPSVFTVVPKKTFYKILPVTPPVLLTGSFKLDAKLVATAHGDIDIAQKINLAREIKYTMRYTDAAGYELLKEDHPSALYSLTGTAKAEAEVTISLIPEFKITLYELPYAAINYEAYLTAGAGIEMTGNQALYITPDELVGYQDLDYRFTRLDLQAGGNIGWRIGIKGFDDDLIGYPSDDPNDFKQVEFPAPSTLIGLPSLTLAPDANYLNSNAIVNSRDYASINFIPSSENQGLDFLSRTLLPGSGRIKVFRKNGGIYTEDVTAQVALYWSDDNDTTKPFWLGFPGAGEYKVRYSAFSQFGSWAKQYEEAEITLSDSDNDQIPDYWESRYGIIDAGADGDHDGLTNLQEYQHHTNPNATDSDGGGISDGQEIQDGTNPLDAGDDQTPPVQSVLTLSGGSVTEGDSGTKVLNFTLTLDHYYTTAMVDYTTQDGTATTADNDYNAVSGTMSFVGGSTSETVAVTINGDTDIEATESFSLVLSNPVNLSLANSSAAGIISDDDAPSGTGTLNDTGITWGGDYPDGNNGGCTGTEIGAQDCSHGRDATHNDDSDGHAGFSFTKISSTGQELPASATSWACVKDNITGLIWEVKTDDGGLHDKDDTYNWYNTDSSSNGGAVGYADDDGNTCSGYDSGDSSTFCNTQAYVNRVNNAGWCGATDWRMPTRKELQGIVSFDRTNPSIDTGYFPNTRSSDVWSGSPSAHGSSYAWVVYFYNGNSGSGSRNSSWFVRLVRGGQ